MKIGLIDVDSHNFPNLALMKISAWHKAQGDEVEWWWGWGQYDIVYKSKVFDDTYSHDLFDPVNTKEIIYGGTGYDLQNKLPDEIERMYPDYSLYPELTKDTSFGFLTRGCPNNCPFCIVCAKEGRKSCITVAHDEDTPQVVSTAIHKEDGYKVRYADGYVSWSPKEVFEEAYRLTDGMNFGLAIEAMKKGERVARKGWNGKDMYVFLAYEPDFVTDADISAFDGKEVEVGDMLVMKTAQNTFQPGWLASQADMLADDWYIVE